MCRGYTKQNIHQYTCMCKYCIKRQFTHFSLVACIDRCILFLIAEKNTSSLVLRKYFWRDFWNEGWQIQKKTHGSKVWLRITRLLECTTNEILFYRQFIIIIIMMCTWNVTQILYAVTVIFYCTWTVLFALNNIIVSKANTSLATLSLALASRWIAFKTTPWLFRVSWTCLIYSKWLKIKYRILNYMTVWHYSLGKNV